MDVPEPAVCPTCGAAIELPRAAWFTPGERDFTCPAGHRLFVVTDVQNVVEMDDYRHRKN